MTEDNPDNHANAGATSTWQRILSFFRHEPAPTAVQQLYAKLVTHARYPLYYDDLGVPDTPEGRFEMLALHVGLTIRRLVHGDGREDGQDDGQGHAAAQALIDLMVADLDVNLRELGVGDLSVGKQVKRLAGQLNARIEVLKNAFDGGDHELLRPMLATNAYHGIAAPPTGGLTRLIRCLEAIEQHLTNQPVPGLAEGRIDLPPELTLRRLCLNA